VTRPSSKPRESPAWILLFKGRSFLTGLDPESLQRVREVDRPRVIVHLTLAGYVGADLAP
jgi:hypothetical protein